MNSQVAQPAKRQPKGFQAPERKRVFRTKAWREKSLSRGEKWRKRKKRVAKWGSPPISRVLSSGPVRKPARRAIIPLVDALPRRSSSLPGDSASSLNVPLFGLAPDGVYRAVRVTTSAVGSYPTVSPLPDPPEGGHRRSALCCTFRRFGPKAYGARPLAGILLCGARTFLDARTHRDCLANFPARSIAASAGKSPPRHSGSRSSAARETTSSITQSRRE